MVQEFEKGGSYTEVNYGEYVLIDTIKNRNHKSDLENGLLFRRGFDYDQTDTNEKPNITSREFYDNETNNFLKTKWQAAWSNWVEKVGGGAIYVGQIVGPQGDAPELFPLSWQTFEEKVEQLEENSEYNKDRFVTVINPVSQTQGFKWEYDPDYPEGTEGAEEHRIPVYDDTVKFASITLKDNDGNITGANVAFDIPQPTIKVSAQVVNAYGDQALNVSDRTRTHYDEASKIIDSGVEITVQRDQNHKIVGYSDLIHQHSATGKEALDGNNELDPHPFYLNYDIAIPRGIHGNDIASTQIETTEQIVGQNPQYEYDIKDYDYEEGWEEGMEGAEQHKTIPIYWTEEDEGYENHKRLKEKDSHNHSLVPEDEYITFSLRNYDIQEDGTIIDAHVGRFPYRVLNKIKKIKTERRFFNPAANNENIQNLIGQIYKYQNSNNLYAICIKEGTITNIDFKDNSNNLPLPGYICSEENNENSSKWRVVNFDEEAASGLQLDYKAGESDFLSTNFLDYIYLDDYGYLHAVYTQFKEQIEDNEQHNQPALDTLIGFIDTISSIEHNDGLFKIHFLDSKRSTSNFYVNAIVDMQKYGSELYVLYSDKTVREYYKNNTSKVKKLKYSGINPYSRFNEEYDILDPNTDQKYFYYIKIYGSTDIGFNYQGNYELSNLIWIADENNPFTNVIAVGQIADVEKIIYNNTYQQEGNFYYGKDEPFIFSPQQQGRIVTIKEVIDNNGDPFTIIYNYIYNFNDKKQPYKINTNIEDLVFTKNQVINPIQGQETYHITDLIDQEDISNYAIYSYWYQIQQTNEASIDPKRIYILSEQDYDENENPVPYQNYQNLNINGLWLILQGGND